MPGPRCLLFTTMLFLLLSACSSSPPVRYFTLGPIDAEFRQDPEDAVIIGVGPLRIPEYLDRSQIVTRGVNSEMQVDEFNRWSEPLATSLLRIVSSDIDNLLQGVVVIVFPYEPFVRDLVKYRLVGGINRFDADHLGRVVLEVQWGIGYTDGKVVVPVRRNRYHSQATSASDPGAVAKAMNDALAKFSRDIAGKLESLL